ncbi:MAG: RagB/SusD family nutrient uptake outer membrane protein [Marinifilaceae bacterium]
MNIQRLFLVLVIVIAHLVCGCESILDLEPKNSVTFDHFFQTEKDLEATVAQMHSDMRSALARVTYHEHMGAKIDKVHGGSIDFQRLRQLDPVVITAVDKQQQWKPYYNTLHMVDIFLDNQHKAQGVSVERRQFYLGQAYFIRSVMYFYLARIWGDAVITVGSKNSEKLGKSSAETVIDTAIVNALKAYDYVPKYGKMVNSANKSLVSKQYGCKGSVAALLAHLYAWKGALYDDEVAYEASVEWANKILDDKFKEDVGDYSLATSISDVCDKELVRRGVESLFEVEISYTDHSNYGVFLPVSFLLSWPVKYDKKKEDIIDCQYQIYKTSVNKLYEETDSRRAEYFYNIDSVHYNSAGLAYVYKWRNALYRDGGFYGAYYVNIDANKVIFRVADIQLLRAECNAKIGKLDLAVKDLNTIRGRANATLYPNGKNDVTGALGLQKAIFREREKELFLEGHRYWDVVRNKGYYKTELSEGFTLLSDNDVRNGALYLPVPNTAFQYNDLMQQNTYWMSKMK